MKRKIPAIFISISLILSNPVFLSASPSEFSYDGRQQIVPVVPFDPDEPEMTSLSTIPPSSDIPSGTAVPDPSPLSLPDEPVQDSGIRSLEGSQSVTAGTDEWTLVYRDVSLELRGVNTNTVEAVSGHYYRDTYGNPFYYTDYNYRGGLFMQKTGTTSDLHTFRGFMEVDLSALYEEDVDPEQIARVELVFDTVSAKSGSYAFSIYDMNANEDGLFPSGSASAGTHYTGSSSLVQSVKKKTFRKNVSQQSKVDVTESVLRDLRAGKLWTGFFATPDSTMPKIQLSDIRLKVTYGKLVPPVTGTIAINSGTTYTSSRTVKLNLSATDNGSGMGVGGMSFSNDNIHWTSITPYAKSKSYELPSGDGEKTVYVRYYDEAGNVSETYSTSIILDTRGPKGKMTVNGGEKYIHETTVTLNLSAMDDGSGVGKMCFSSDGTFWTEVEDYAETKEWTFPSGDGYKKVYVKFQDKSGRWSVVSGVKVKLDTQIPTGSIKINAGAAYTSFSKVKLNFTGSDKGSGMSGVSFSFDGTNWEPLVRFVSSKSVVLPAGDGVKTVYVKFYDKAGNASPVYSDTIIMDTLPPTGTVEVNGGARFINQPDVTLNLNAVDEGSGLSKMSFSSNGTTWTSAENYSETKEWTFPSGDGAKKVYVKFQDNRGRWSSVTSVTVTLDTVKPTGSININSGATETDTLSVTLNLSATDNASGIAGMSFSTGDQNWTPPEAFTTSRAFTLPDGDGYKTIFVRFYDQAGNVSAVFSKSIKLTTATSVIVIDSETPTLINQKVLTINYTLDGVDKQKTFTNLVEGENVLTITETNQNGEQTTISHRVTVDTIPPAIVVDAGTPSLINMKTLTVSYAVDGVIKQKTFTDLVEGANALIITETDLARNPTTITLSVFVDPEAPSGSALINNGASYTNASEVRVTVDALDNFSSPGRVEVSFSQDGVHFSLETLHVPTDGSSSPFYLITLNGFDGEKTLFIRLRDEAGNVTTFSQKIILERTPPQGSISLDGYPSNNYFYDFPVTLSLNATDAESGVSLMRFSLDGGSLWTDWENYKTSRTISWQEAMGLYDYSGTDPVVFSVEYKDFAGNVGTESFTSTRDGELPQGTMAINGGSEYTNNREVTLALTAHDAISGVRGIQIQVLNQDGSYYSDTGLIPFELSKTVVLPTGDGEKTVLYGVCDWTACTYLEKTITLDTIAPSVVVDPSTPTSINAKTMMINYTSDGVAKTRTFVDLKEGENTLSITESDLAGNQTTIQWVVTVTSESWIPAASNPDYSFRVVQNEEGYRLELRYNPGGGITILASGTGKAPDTFDVTPDGSKVIYESHGNAYVQRVGEPWTAVTVQGDLSSIHYYNNYVMLKTDRTYPSGTVIRYSTGVTIDAFNPQYLSTFFVTLVTPGTGFYRSDDLRLAVQPEYDPLTGHYQVHIYDQYGGDDYSASVRTVDLGVETGNVGGTFTLVDAVAAPGGATVITVGLDSPTGRKTFLVNQEIVFDGAAISVSYEGRYAVYTVRADDGTLRTVRFDLETLKMVPQLPAIELVQPVITQMPGAANQWTLQLDQGMRGVRYEVQFTNDPVSGTWQTAGEFIAENYGEVSWQDPVQDRGRVVYRAIPREITTAADTLAQINMLYLEPEFGLVDSTHEYPLEAWLQRHITQPSNFGFYANLLATIASGDLVTSTISREEAVRRLDVMMTHLLEDQETLGYLGLLPWLGHYNGDWQRMDDLYGHQVSFEDNTNMTAGLAVAYGALLDDSLAGNATIHGEGGILEKIDTFLENQRPGYEAMYRPGDQTFARSMVIADGRLEGTVDLFGAESMGPLLFLVLQYGDAFPAGAYQKLHFSTTDYTLQDGSTLNLVEPFSGAFQMYWPALFMPESDNPDLRAMLEAYTDAQLDFMERNDHPGILSASYDVVPYDLLSRYVTEFTWQGDTVSLSRGSDGSYHLTAGSSQGIGVAFTDDSKYGFEGSEVQIRYASQTAVSNARLEFKQNIGGVLTTVYVQDLALENTGGEVRTLSLRLPENGVLGNLSEVVFATSGSTDPLDLTFYHVGLDRIQYNFSLGINEIAMNGVSETTPSTYNLGAAYMFRPAQVEALLQKLIADHPELITAHGLWEGLNMTTGTVVKEQVFNNVLAFTLGVAGTGGDSMSRYLEAKGLMTELNSVWDSQESVSLTSGATSGSFEWDGWNGTFWQRNGSVRASGREVRVTYQSDTPIQGAKLELKHAGSNDPAFTLSFDLPATGSGTGEYVIEIPESYLYWYISEAVVLFPKAEGVPSETILNIVVAPEGVVTAPTVVIDPLTPDLINVKSLSVTYRVDGIARTKLFEGLAEGLNTLWITPEDVPGLPASVSWKVTVDTIAPVVVLDSRNPSVVNTTSLTVLYTVDGAAKEKVFNGLVAGMNALTVEELDEAGNRASVTLQVQLAPDAQDFLKGPIVVFSFDGGNVGSQWVDGQLRVTSLDFHGVGVSAIVPGIDVVGKRLQFRYATSTTPAATVKIEFKKRDQFGVIRVVGARYFDLKNTHGEVYTVNLGIIPAGIPNDLDEITFVAQGSGGQPFDISIYGFLLY